MQFGYIDGFGAYLEIYVYNGKAYRILVDEYL